MRPHFLLDEHVNRAVQRQVRRRSVELVVLAIGDPEAPPAGTSDPDLLVWLERHGALLVTENRSTMPEHLAVHFAAGHHIPGILWIRPGVRLGRLIEELFLLWSCSTADEYQDAQLFIPL